MVGMNGGYGFKGTLLQRSDSLFHVASGVATAIISPLLAVPYGVHLWRGGFRDDLRDSPQCDTQSVVYGFEYAIGYFAVQYLYAYVLGPPQ